MKKGKKLKERDKKGFKYYLKRDWQLYVLLFFPLAFAIVFKFLQRFLIMTLSAVLRGRNS